MLNGKVPSNYYKEILLEKGIKNTETRLSVLEVFSRSKKPISALYICKKLLGKINEATVYRMLSLFEEKGILRRVNLRKESIYFELNNDHHHHIVCIKCGSIEDFKESIEIENLLEKIIKKSIKFKNIKEHSLELFGVCKMCN